MLGNTYSQSVATLKVTLYCVSFHKCERRRANAARATNSAAYDCLAAVGLPSIQHQKHVILFYMMNLFPLDELSLPPGQGVCGAPCGVFAPLLSVGRHTYGIYQGYQLLLLFERSFVYIHPYALASRAVLRVLKK